MTRQQFLRSLLVAGGRTTSTGEGLPPLMPATKRFERGTGVCSLTHPLRVEMPQESGLAQRSVQLALGGSFRAQPVEGGKAEIRLRTGDPGVGGRYNGAYRIEIGSRQLTITAAAADGLLMGLRTVAQLGLTGSIPQGVITDWPDVEVRSAHLCYHLIRESLAYNCPNFNALIHHIDGLAALKYNAVLLELESMFPYRRHPAISCKLAFTRAQVTELCEQLAAQRMEVVPLVQCLGHAYNVLIHDEYAGFREVPGTIQQYCPLNPKLPDLYMEFVDEYQEIFPGLKQWHIGGDESRQLARCPRCKEKAAKQGLSRLYVDHVAEIAGRLHRRGITPLLWSDMLEHYPDALRLLPGYVTIVYWNYDPPEWPRPYATELFRKNRFRVAGAPAVRFGSSGTELSVYYPAALRGLETLIPRIQREGTSEVLVTNWMKGSPHENTHYGFAYAADLCWNTGTRREDFQRRYAWTEFGAEDAALCQVYDLLSLPLPYAEPVQRHMPDHLNRFNLSGLRFPEKWQHYTSPAREPLAFQQMQHAIWAANAASTLLEQFASGCSRGRRQLELLALSAACIRAKAEFGLALHEGNRLELGGANGQARWLHELPRIQAAWCEAKQRHRRLLEVSGFAPSVAFLNELMFEPAEYAFLEAMAGRLRARS